eukprot:CAMPEP_0114510994 /NCGR_PEP_ID=MMETSP0109-20121206/14110_1 /TAXON_ID=29199 /ORGANISM="Chlorarachnion reptans, Strain CCCM449" /LENGTH=296 /DNA_ID=CAMNT_0001690391 /DNA_START=57 /DNA_END=947 /DNA_ORIENTATION=-
MFPTSATRLPRSLAKHVLTRSGGLRLVRVPLSTRIVPEKEAAAARAVSQSARMSTVAETEEMKTESHTALIAKRYQLTTEVIASKVFWAGFGWQGSSVIAEQMGYGADTGGFALVTGGGEATAVFLGHSLFYTLIKGGVAKDELSTALWLGTGTFFSGTAWQPVVNVLCDVTGNFFPAVAAGTMVACGSAFYAGLRVGRALWGETLGLPVAKRDYDNLNSDAGLSVAIGGATAMFVACDGSMVMNMFSFPFGVLDTDTTLMAMVRAGGATATGYGIVQAWQNLFPKGRNWMDIYLK